MKKMKKKTKWTGWNVGLMVLVICLIIFWYLHHFPTTNKIVLFGNITETFRWLPADINLPFIIPRMLDIPVIALILFMATKLWHYLKRPKNKNESSVIGLFMGTLIGTIIGISFFINTDINLYTKIIFYGVASIILLAGLTIGIGEKLQAGLKFSLIVGISSGIMTIIIGMKNGFLSGLATYIIFFLLITIVTVTIVVIGNAMKHLIFKRMWYGFLNLLKGMSFND